MPKYDKKFILKHDIYKHYKEISENPVDYKKHSEVLDIWGKLVSEYLLEGKDVTLHRGLSRLGVRKRVKKTYVDRRASKLERKLVIKPNLHSANYGARVYWGHHKATVNCAGWEFHPARTLSRALAVVMKSYMGHARFVQRARVTRKSEQQQQLKNINLYKI